MAEATTNTGQDWLSEKAVGNVPNEELYIIAVGTGTTDPTESDTSLQSEVYRSNDGNTNCTVDTTTNTGEIVGRITVSGGTEVPAGTDITEIGLFVDDGSTLVFREVRTAVTIESGDRKTFEFTIVLDDI